MMVKSLKDLYDDTCKEQHIHANSQLLSSLPDRQGAGLPTDVLDICCEAGVCRCSEAPEPYID